MPAATLRSRGARLDVGVDAAVGLVVAGVLLAGLARPGFPLLRDWVATPAPPLSDAALGLGESAARAVPQDVAMAWASAVLDVAGIPVWPLTGLLTAVFCVWLAVAAGGLARRALAAVPVGGPWRESTAPAVLVRMPAVVVAVWNPYVVERLLQGHWSLLAGVAAAVSMPVLLARARPRVAAACVAVVAAGLTPTGWLLAVIAGAMSLVCAPRGRRARSGWVVAAVALVTALPWLLATALASATGLSGATGSSAVGLAGGPGGSGVAAFAARAEPGIGTLGSVVALGGIWNSEAVPPSRATWWAVVALALLIAVWVIAAAPLWRARHDPVVRATVPLAVVVWTGVAVAATGPGLAALDTLVSTVPGAGLLRDTQKFVALAVPATVVVLTLACRALASRIRPVGAALALAAVVVSSAPDAPAALWGALRPVTYGAGWAEVNRIVSSGPGDVLVLPAGAFRSTPLWAGGTAVLDPAPRLLDARVLVPGDLLVGGASSVAGEGGRARAATEALMAGRDPQVLAGLGVRWVLDERTSAGPRGEAERTLEGTAMRFSDSELTLYEIAAPSDSVRPSGQTTVAVVPAASPATRAAVLAAHAVWLLAGAVAAGFALRGPRAARSRAAG